MGGAFANRWSVVFASMCGLLVGTGPVLIFSFGVFLKPVAAELGVSRGTLSTAVLIATLVGAAACPALGYLLDRFGVRRVMIPGIVLYALAVAGFGFMQTRPAFLIPLIFAIVGLIGVVQSPIPYSAVAYTVV